MISNNLKKKTKHANQQSGPASWALICSHPTSSGPHDRICKFPRFSSPPATCSQNMISCLLLLDRLAASPSLTNIFQLVDNYQHLKGDMRLMTTTWRLPTTTPAPPLSTFNRMIMLREGAGRCLTATLIKHGETLHK